jgi:hypothetical protein
MVGDFRLVVSLVVASWDLLKNFTQEMSGIPSCLIYY